MENINREELKNLIREVMAEKQEEKENETLHNYEIKRIGHLSLGYVYSGISKTYHEDAIEICKWNNDFSSRWTIARFKYDEEYNYYKLESCGNRLNDNDINWADFGVLVKEGYKYLDNYID